MHAAVGTTGDRPTRGNARGTAAIAVGIGSVLGGIGGAVHTYQQAAVQDITTPDDARFAEVAGPGFVVLRLRRATVALA